MNPQRFLPPGHRLASFAFALVLTLATLAGVDGLARSDPSPLQMAQTAHSVRG